MAKTEKKIAIVLIHGIGDQQPMATLRSFVAAVIGPGADGKPAYWSKPDEVSGSFDLRRLSCPGAARDGQRTAPIDFYEYYWAHRMEGTALGHSVQWLNQLLLRAPGSVPHRLRILWWLCWLALVLGAVLVATLASTYPGPALALVLGLGAGLAKAISSLALRDWIGDAARYFSSRPANIAVREAIRRGGVDLLDKLHRSGDYHRIIVVGHSLGSAIALDVLYHHWTLSREGNIKPENPKQEAISQLEKLLVAGGPIGPEVLRPLQKQIWQEARENGVPWRVTDLVTLGSPLAHYPFLTDLNDREFRERLDQRELPRCPPVLDGKGISYWVRYTAVSGAQRSIGELHHAACFAATRWTNIYFPHNRWFRGDPVGGPLQENFGLGIDDRPVLTSHWLGRLNHLDYWRDDPRDTHDNRPLKVLQEVLALAEGFRAKQSAKAAVAKPGNKPTNP